MSHIDSIMGSNFFKQHIQERAKVGILQYHMKLLQKQYDFLSYKIEKNVLICTGEVTSPDFIHNYRIEIRCVAGLEPWCKIVTPESIKPSREIHMYTDHSLCLHYPPDMKWNGKTLIYKFTIPWVIEWIHFYEIFLINGGIWEGRESPAHFTDADRNISEDIPEKFS
jgi:hypothetical protein